MTKKIKTKEEARKFQAENWDWGTSKGVYNRKTGVIELHSPEKLEKKEKEIKEALKTSKKPIQRLGQGIHKDNFYYGTSLIWKGKPISAIILDDGTIYLGLDYITWTCETCGYKVERIQSAEEKPIKPKRCKCRRYDSEFQISEIRNPIKDEFGLNYRTEFNDEAIDYVWKTASIKRFRKEKYKKIGIRSIFDKIVEINQKYIEHLNPTSHKFIACWIIGTYCYTLFEQFGRLYLRADRGSGKTKQCRIKKFLSFNPMWITKGTESSIFRDAEATCGTFIVDNMDKLHDDLKRAIEHYIETGWMWDATYRLSEKTEGIWGTQRFKSYTPMALNNIFGLDENTIDKTFEISMLKSINPNIQRTKPTSKSENWEAIRNSIRYWMLDNWEKVQENYEKIAASFSGREFDVVEGVLTIAKTIGDDIFEEIEEYVKEKLSEELIDLENNNSYLVFSEIWKDFIANPLMQEKNVFLSDIADTLFSTFNPNLEKGTQEYNNRKKGFSKYLAKIIRSVPMFRKGGVSQGRTYITIKRKDLKQYMVLQHFINEDGTLLITTTSTTTTKLPKPTFNKTKEKVGVVEQVGVVEEEYRVEESEK